LAYIAPFSLISEQLATRGREGPSHYLYLASAGVIVLLALGIHALGTRAYPSRRWGWILMSFSVLSITLSSVWSIWRLQPLSLYNTGH
jgi:hypothetical protein